LFVTRLRQNALFGRDQQATGERCLASLRVPAAAITLPKFDAYRTAAIASRLSSVDWERVINVRAIFLWVCSILQHPR
jgi:hypothetical protein